MHEDRYRSEYMRDDRATQIKLHLAECSTDVLENELAELIGSESDSVETLDLIDAYLVELEKRPSCEPDISAEESLHNFHEKYATLFEMNSCSEPVYRPQKRCRIPVGRFVVIAAVITVMVSLLALQASGVDLFGSISRWTSETFQLIFSGSDVIAEDSPESSAALTELQTALDFHGITDAVAPKYLPAGYEQIDFQAEEDGSLIMALYQHNENYITIQICKIENSTGYSVQKDDNSPEVYTVNGVDYSIMTNKGDFSAVWNTSEYECTILNVSSKEELYRMLDSIYKGD